MRGSRYPPSTYKAQHAQGEGRVRSHGDAPSTHGGLAGVEGEVDQCGRRHPTNGGKDGYRDASPFAQLAHVELAAELETGNEKEECHQPVVDPRTAGPAR